MEQMTVVKTILSATGVGQKTLCVYIFENSKIIKRVLQLISKNGSTFHYAPLFKIVSIFIKCL